MISLLLAIVAAILNAFSAVWQRKANRDEAQERAFGASLLMHLLSNRVWLLGAGAMVASFLVQATALAYGPLSVVEPVLVLELPLALVLGSAVLRRPLQRRDWWLSAAMAAGLALLIAVLDPHGGDARHISTGLAIGATLATMAGVVVLCVAATRARGRVRSALFGAAAGSGFGLTAALIKLSVAQLDANGAAALFSAWETYGFALTGLASVGLVQAALNAGTLVSAQPGITLLDPLVSVLWGTVVTDESTRTGPVLLLAVVGAATIVVAAIWLARATLRVQVGTT